MSLELCTRQVNEVAIVDVVGQIKLGEGCDLLCDTVKWLLDRGEKSILLNLAEVDYIDSSGIGALVSVFSSVRNRDGELKLLHLTRKVHNLLLITKLYTVFHVMEDEAAAIAAFRAMPA